MHPLPRLHHRARRSARRQPSSSRSRQSARVPADDHHVAQSAAGARLGIVRVDGRGAGTIPSSHDLGRSGGFGRVAGCCVRPMPLAPRMSPASWTATDGGRRRGVCPVRPVTPRVRRTSPASFASRCSATSAGSRCSASRPRTGSDRGTEVRHILALHEKLFARVDRAQPARRPPAVDRAAVRRARRPHSAQRAAGDPQGGEGHLAQHGHGAHDRLRLRRAPRARRRRRAGAVRRGRPITPTSISDHLYLPELPPVDVLVRTSGERRVSNFLLWQSAGAAVYFSPTNWPEFDAGSSTGPWRWRRDRPPTRRRSCSPRPPRALPAAEERPGQREMARRVADAFERRRASRGAGGHRHRQVVGLSRRRRSPLRPRPPPVTGAARVTVATIDEERCPGRVTRRPGGRRDGDEGTAGPAGDEGSALPRRDARRAVRRSPS